MNTHARKRRISARSWGQRGNASQYISPVDSLTGPLSAVLWCRVSGREQQRTSKLDRQVENLIAEAERRGITVVDVIRHVGSGTDPTWLVRASILAKEHGAIILAECTDRFVRHPGFMDTNQDAQARDFDLEDLARAADGVTLATILHPDAPASEVRSYQRTRLGCNPGRPQQEMTQAEMRAAVWKQIKRL